MPARWNEVAGIRRRQIESGVDITHNEVFKPVFVEFVKEFRPKNALEVGAGTGHFSIAVREYAENLTAIEPSAGMHAIATEVLSGTDVNLKNLAISDLPHGAQYDLAFSHLVAHCVDDFGGFIAAISDRLLPKGLFLFSIPHPCFYNDYKKFFGDDYRYTKQIFKEVSFFISKDQGQAIAGVPYHHRPLSFYLNEVVASGLAIVEVNEIYPSEEVQAKYGGDWIYPRYCTFLCRKN
ncbi:MAG: class I SAM-dependent methyltransferase [Stenotrophomonas sp.]